MHGAEVLIGIDKRLPNAVLPGLKKNTNRRPEIIFCAAAGWLCASYDLFCLRAHGFHETEHSPAVYLYATLMSGVLTRLVPFTVD